jgi:hypothetical protein
LASSGLDLFYDPVPVANTLDSYGSFCRILAEIPFNRSRCAVFDLFYISGLVGPSR